MDGALITTTSAWASIQKMNTKTVPVKGTVRDGLLMILLKILKRNYKFR